MMDSNKRIDIDQPRYDQSTYQGRAKRFFTITNPLNILKSSAQLEEAHSIVHRYRAGENIPGLDEEKLWRAKNLYDSAFHPETGEKMLFLGRMSFQVPGNMVITGCMLNFYKSTPAVVFWQWINQTFNATVNYTNRSGDAHISNERLATSYVLATSGAVVTALGINRTVSKLPPLIGRWVPFIAVAAANCINIPCMRSREIMEGLTVTDQEGNKLTTSTTAAKTAITQVVLSRIGMAVPGMIIPPIVMVYLEKRGVLARYKFIGAPLQVLMCGLLLSFATPLCCALFPQQSSIAFSKLESRAQMEIRATRKVLPERVYFNKGL